MLKELFGRRNPVTLAREQLRDAKYLALEHELSAKHHAALAKMYRERVESLTPVVEGYTPKPREMERQAPPFTESLFVA